MKKNILDSLNDQLNYELYSAYIYYSMAAYFDSMGLKGLSNWMQVQTKEEMSHADRFYNYINDRGGRVVLDNITKPRHDWESPLHAFENALQHEQKVTERINNIASLAMNERDHATHNFMQWFISEQVEEEASVGEIADKLKLIKDSPDGLFMLDRELMQRQYVPPQP